MDTPYLPPIPLPAVPALPFHLVSLIIQLLIGAILLALLIRAIASWFQLDERIAFIRFLARITDPFIDPCRKYVRNIGIIDFSWIIAFFLLSTLEVLLIQALPRGW